MHINSQKHSDIVFNSIGALVEAQGDDSLPARRYKSLAKRAGGILRTVGLVQFLSFLAAKAGESHYRSLLDHLTRELDAIDAVPATTPVTLLSKVRQMDLPDYMRTTSLALQLLQWHGRISDIMITGTAGGDAS